MVSRSLRGRRFASLGPSRTLALHRVSATTASLHVAPGRFTTMLNPRQIPAFAPWQDVRFGSLADVVVSRIDVRFTPESRHVRCSSPCLLWANSGHRAASFDHLVRAATHEPKVVHACS